MRCIFSSILTVTPRAPSSSMVVVISCKCGKLPIVTGCSASNAAKESVGLNF